MTDIPIKVSKVHFTGTERTKTDVLQPAVQPCFQAETFGQLTQSLSQVSQNLARLEIFKDYRFVIDHSGEEGDGGLLVRVEVTERKYKVHAGTEIQKNEVGLGMGGTLYNVFGRAEKLEAQAALGSKSATPLSITLTKPVSGHPDRLLRLSCFSTLQHYIDGANYKNRLQGLSATYTFPSRVIRGAQHEVKYNLDWRHVFDIADGASITVRRNAGHSIKSSLSHTLVRCSRDCLVFPSRGALLKVGTEVSGLGGSVAFARGDLTAQSHLSLYKKLVLNTSVRLGHISPLLGQKVALLDKYQMGGPLSVRGFALNSLGPKDRHDSIGGDLSAEAGVGLSFPFSPSTSHMVRGHIFANAGILMDYDRGQGQGLKGNWQRLLAHTSNTSVGAGIQVKLGEAGRLEMNVAYPIGMQRSAMFHRGLQVGLGVEFL